MEKLLKTKGSGYMAFLFYMILVLVLFSIILLLSKIQIEIQKFEYKRKTYKNNLSNKKETKTNNDFLIKFKLCIFNIVPITFLKINNKKLDKLKEKKMFVKIGKRLKNTMDKMQLQFIDKLIKNQSQKTILDVLSITKELKLKFKKVDLKVDVGLSDVIATSFLIPTITTIISFFFRNTNLDLRNSKYTIKPIYNQSKFSVNPIYNLENYGSEINIFLKCIIEVKMIHIINIMYIIKKQRKVSNYVRPSNRRSYDYSYE